MRPQIQQQIKKGSRIRYDDGRSGHQGIEAMVLNVDPHGMKVQFEDRADTNYILFSDPKWMEFIAIVD